MLTIPSLIKGQILKLRLRCGIVNSGNLRVLRWLEISDVETWETGAVSISL